ncbi:Cdc37 N terminal kinase binding-domain-containing protein [Myxozyma melibiosi]|uniref:Cdc37 N terminal kinase binding-domain-containing protein n=1 Tax=Myxozyma melibiosi TaxID=54550 RepID=A0ABR1F1R7_9ASCO
MVVDYSKWDKLELSDDSDIEVHPNVDKKSFIRWKQQDIHEKRTQRRHEIESLKAENAMNSSLLDRLNRLIASLKSVADSDRAAVDASLKEAVKETGGAEKAPESGPSYGAMMESLVGQVLQEVKTAVEKEGKPFVETLRTTFEKHQKKLSELQDACVKKLTSLQNEEAKHITSEDLKIGFDSTKVSKKKESIPATTTKTTEKKIEVLNPTSSSAKGKEKLVAPDPGDEADDESEPVSKSSKNDADDEDEDYKISPLAEKFAAIKLGDYQKCLSFIGEHPSIVSEDEADGILYEAFGKEMKNEHAAAKRYVHNALLLQYCARLGRDGVTVFFRKIMTPNHPSLGAFLQDVEQTYSHIKQRSVYLLEEQKLQAANEDMVEEEEIIDLETVTDEKLAELGLTREDIERFKKEQEEKDAAEDAAQISG